MPVRNHIHSKSDTRIVKAVSSPASFLIRVLCFIHLTHRALQFWIIATALVSDAVARRICELELQFPEASIN